MLLYLYGDVFGFFRRDIVTDVAAGKTGFIGTQGRLLAAAVMISIPSVVEAVLTLLIVWFAWRWPREQVP